MKPDRRPLGLYIHVPFCARKCAYCDFYSLAGREDRMDDYVSALCAHLAEAAPLAAGYEADTVYFGGGTPSLLGPRRLEKILHLIGKKYHMARDPEITWEANPDSIGDWKAVRSLRKAGFNRLSLGMQDAHDETLREIGRVHTMDQVRAAVDQVMEHFWQDGGVIAQLEFGLGAKPENVRAALEEWNRFGWA